MNKQNNSKHFLAKGSLFYQFIRPSQLSLGQLGLRRHTTLSKERNNGGQFGQVEFECERFHFDSFGWVHHSQLLLLETVSTCCKHSWIFNRKNQFVERERRRLLQASSKETTRQSGSPSISLVDDSYWNSNGCNSNNERFHLGSIDPSQQASISNFKR